MFKKLLISLGLRSAPAPIQRGAMIWSFVGGLPALAYVAWKYRNKLASAAGSAKRLVAPSQTTPEPTGA